MEFQTEEKFDLIIFNNVLEHVIDPVKHVRKANEILHDKGVIRVQVPNDLSYSQYLALKKRETGFYFFCPPEHLHYFDFKSLQTMLEKNGFEVVKTLTTWPMDFFIQMGLDYSVDK